jgi:hypothetical protein
VNGERMWITIVSEDRRPFKEWLTMGSIVEEILFLSYLPVEGKSRALGCTKSIPQSFSTFPATFNLCPSQGPGGLRPRSAAERLLEPWVRIPPRHGCLSLVSVCVVR